MIASIMANYYLASRKFFKSMYFLFLFEPYYAMYSAALKTLTTGDIDAASNSFKKGNEGNYKIN